MRRHASSGSGRPRFEHHLALAVISHVHALEHGRGHRSRCSARERCRRIGNLAVNRQCRMPIERRKSFLAQPVLGDFEDFGPRQHRRRNRRRGAPPRRGCSRIRTSRCRRRRQTASSGLAVGEVSDRRGGADLLGRTVALVGEDVAAIAEPRRRRGPSCGRAGRRPVCRSWRPELQCPERAAAPRHPPSALAASRPEIARRQCRIRARIAAAKSAALIAPDWPIANVATGMPAGIWTIDKQAVHALQGSAFDRHAQHRKRGQRRRHSREVSRPAGAGDDHP